MTDCAALEKEYWAQKTFWCDAGDMHNTATLMHEADQNMEGGSVEGHGH